MLPAEAYTRVPATGVSLNGRCFLAAPILILVLLLGVQEEVIQRNDSARNQYQEAVQLCRMAEELIDADPKTAAARLTDLLDKFAGLPKVECRLRIKVFADDPGAPFSYFPYQFRGRARLLQSQAKGLAAPERRDLAESSVRDFEQSVAHGAESSKTYLLGARLEWWKQLRPILSREGWVPARAAAAGKANEVLSRLAESGQNAVVKEAVNWLSLEVSAVERRVKSLSRSTTSGREAALLEIAWCDMILKVVQGLAPAAAEAEEVARVRAAAAEIAGFRGYFQLKICVSPWAEVVRCSREGKVIDLESRETPLRIPIPLEIGDFEIDLVHPRWGKRTKSISAQDLQEGKTFVLSGDMETGRLTLTLSP
jgi:hypothetical protein